MILAPVLPRSLATIVLLLAVPAGAAETIRNVFPCGKEGAAGGLAGGTDLIRYTIDNSRYPEAVCNDGTPAIFYFGAHTRPEDRNKWLIFLQGGGSCLDAQGCAERWCSIDTNFGMDKMTSSVSKSSIRGSGFLEPAARNGFGTWNRILIYYCSSDLWSGTKTAVLQATLGSGGVREYQIHFKGSSIIDAVFDTLRYVSPPRRRIVARAPADPGTTRPWPDLDAATHVIFAGSSAGGNGVRSNADRLGAELRAANATLTDYRALIDATYSPLPEKLDYSQTALCASDVVGCRYDTLYAHLWNTGYLGLHGTRTDESCLQFHSLVEPGTEWRCGDNEHAVLHHVTTPFLMRADLLDSLQSSSFVNLNFGTLSDFATLIEGQLRNLPVPEDSRSTTPGLFVPQCTDHEAFTNNSRVFDLKVSGVSYHDTVWNWWTGAQPQQVIRQFTGNPAPAPECP